MRNRIHLVVLSVLTVGAGIIVLLPVREGVGDEIPEGRKDMEAPSAKSARSSTNQRGGNPLAVTSDSSGALTKERASRLSSGNFNFFGRTFVLPASESWASAASPQREQGDASWTSPTAAQGGLKSGQGNATSSRKLAAKAIAHRQGRREFMRQRYAELASHTPGCKCAYHTGKK